jgi:hypothetical protein
VFWPLQLRFKFLRVPKDSQVPFLGVWVATSHFPQSRVATPGLPSGSLEIAPVRTPAILEPHNFANKPWIEMLFETTLQLSSKAFQRYVARPLRPSKSGWFPTLFWSRVKLIVWLSTLLLAITCVLDVQMSNANPF